MKEQAWKAHVEPDRQEKEALAALKRALPDTMAQTIVIQRYATMDECTQHLAELEALQEEKNLILPAASASPSGGKPARTRPGKVRQVAAVTSGRGTAGPASPRRSGASGRKRRISSSGSDTSERSLRDEIHEGFRALGRDLRRWAQAFGQASAQPADHKPPGSPGRKAARSGWPNSKQTCFICGSADHWRADCPKEDPKEEGASTGSGALPRSRQM